MNPKTCVIIDTPTRQKIGFLARSRGMVEVRHLSPVIRDAVDALYAIEKARQTLSEDEFVAFFVALYK